MLQFKREISLPIEPPGRAQVWPYLRLMLLAGAVAAGGILIWHLADLLLLVFGAILVALLIRALSSLVQSYFPVGETVSLVVAGVLIAGVLTGFGVVLGTQLQSQLADLLDRLPELVRAIEERFGITNAQAWLEERAQDFVEGEGLASSVMGYSSWLLGILADVLLVVVAGIYLAIRPGLYRDGFAQLFPKTSRAEARETLNAVGGALKLWLLGQLAAMVLVGLLTTLGLWLLGIPSALALGFIAGLLEFVPLVGPVLSAVPAIAIGLAEGPYTALWVAGLYLLIQQLEGNFITPLIQQRAVELPPAVTIFAIVGFGILFGPLGVLLATPLAVVCFVLVKKLWVREVLDEDTEIPGETEEP